MLLMNDNIIKVGESHIQHGKHNDRIYLMKLHESDFPGITQKLHRIAMKNGYAKIFAKVPEWAKDEFFEHGFKQEALIPNFYYGKNAVYFLAKYYSPTRAQVKQKNKIDEIVKISQEKDNIETYATIALEFSCRILDTCDAKQMAEVYKKVFPTYPFPINDYNYLIKTMQENFIYFGIIKGKEIVSLASCEMDVEAKNVEMTDFATLTQYRGRGLATYLLLKMEGKMQEKGMLTSYTIARSLSLGMNITFAKGGYKYCGTLVNNTNIYSGLESMNVWYKDINVYL